MSISSYGFIIKAPGYSPANHRSVIENPQFRSEVVCVSTLDQAEAAARAMAAAGIEVIELCGGFGEQAMQALVDALGTDVPVGYVTFAAGEFGKLQRLMQRD